MPDTMKAAVIHQAGGPEAIQIERRPRPVPKSGQVLIQVKAFGINRSELFTRRGQSPGVAFPRILGIEAAGVVAQAPDGDFATGDIVMTAMGGMGRQYDGGYAEYVCVPSGQVQKLETSLPWDVLGAMPEMLQTAWGSLFKALQLKAGERLLVRGGTTSIGLAAAAIAKNQGAFVIATTRNAAREDLLLDNGADQVVIDGGEIAAGVRAIHAEGVDKVLELIGVTTLKDSLRCTRQQGLVCMTGIVGNQWSFEQFSPMEAIPSAVGLTVYSGGVAEFMETPLQALADDIAAGTLRLNIGRVFPLEDIVEAHRLMDANTASGKIVVLT
ncbi:MULTISPECIES: zinc-binding alcohol dehydrogenase family protein [unclassified Beijerinckia]|uniref:zinc-binding alcohol dehydrogenase family protein n=1 Tax=unclassified Beijerinckia TaxID=2638183 RepID=UPI00089B47AE|nr:MULTISPECIES: zinc-binding alcohol dehydrogenase family protein [unclassified Beijerinckia]MDH7795391.1 NADPH:quinone reductase-like Zn-dependent oxidoreductase [Beijerinckia sp. GAS462]SEB99655.1 NADPH:quinone reductase [Beijerinckia sp. 28-YEA-48]